MSLIFNTFRAYNQGPALENQFLFVLFSQTNKQLGSYFQSQNISKCKQLLIWLRSDSSHLSVKGVGHFWYYLIILITFGERMVVQSEKITGIWFWS